LVLQIYVSHHPSYKVEFYNNQKTTATFTLTEDYMSPLVTSTSTDSCLRYVGAHKGIAEVCTLQDILLAERSLALQLPEQLKRIYGVRNGFFGPTDCGYLHPLFKSVNGYDGLVDYTKFIWEQDWCPKFLRRCVVYGSDGCGNDWLIQVDTGEIRDWRSSMGDEYEIAEDGILGIWLRKDHDYAIAHEKIQQA
jgi:hypothetical protein